MRVCVCMSGVLFLRYPRCSITLSHNLSIFVNGILYSRIIHSMDIYIRAEYTHTRHDTCKGDERRVRMAFILFHTPSILLLLYAYYT